MNPKAFLALLNIEALHLSMASLGHLVRKRFVSNILETHVQRTGHYNLSHSPTLGDAYQSAILLVAQCCPGFDANLRKHKDKLCRGSHKMRGLDTIPHW